MIYYVLSGVLIFLLIAFFIVTYICFRLAFYVPNKRKNKPLPVGGKYENYLDDINRWAKETEQLSYRDVYIKSFDGLILHGKFYEYKKGAPIEIMFHGYRGTVERDLCGGIQRCFELRRSALLVDHRASGKSQGNVITFGIKERYDCVRWAEFVLNEFGKDVKVLITGISMGAATVLMASSMTLPENVEGVIADCGYSSIKDIIKLTVKKMKLSPAFFYPFIKLGAIIYGGFNPDEYSPKQAMQNAKLPVLFIHGGDDDFVPTYMSEINYDACSQKKKLVIIDGASHGMSFPVQQNTYVSAIEEFFPNDFKG